MGASIAEALHRKKATRFADGVSKWNQKVLEFLAKLSIALPVEHLPQKRILIRIETSNYDVSPNKYGQDEKNRRQI